MTSPITTRGDRQVFVVLALAGAFVASAPTSFAETPTTPSRMWQDATGTFRMEAALVGVGERSVRLRKADGAEIDVPLDRLSSDDARYARSATASAAEALARKQFEATQAYRFVAGFLADPSLPESEKISLRQRVAYWKAAADAGQRRVGNDWLAADAFDAEVARQRETLAEARRLYDERDRPAALAKALEADRKFDRGIDPAFEFATIAALSERDASTAIELLDDVVRRRWRDRDALSPVERANLSAALNNLALAQLRRSQSSKALIAWRCAVDLGLPSVELSHNLGRALRLSTSHVLLNDAQREQADNLFRAVADAFPDDRFDARQGWRYAASASEFPVSLDASELDDAKANATIGDSAEVDLAIMAGGTGVVVAPGYVLVPRELVEGADAITIRAADARTYELSATVFATGGGDETPLALLACPRLAVPAAPLAEELPDADVELRLLGCPLSLRSRSRTTEATVELRTLPPHELGSALPAFRQALLYDVATEERLVGAPLYDAMGRVVALHAGTLYPKGPVAFAGGLSSVAAAKFVRESLPAFNPSSLGASQVEDWSAAASAVDRATVQVLVKVARRPAKLRQRAFPPGHGGWADYEDPFCVECAGDGQVACPEKMCVKGTVPAVFVQSSGPSVRLGDMVIDGKVVRTPSVAPPISNVRRGRMPCATCQASSFVDCPHCADGIDPSLPVREGY